MSSITISPYFFTPSTVTSNQTFVVGGTINGLSGATSTYQIVFDNTNPNIIITPNTRSITATTSYNLASLNSVIQFRASDPAINNTYLITLTLKNFNGTTTLATATANITVRNTLPCFKEGTKILTDQGYKSIEDLQKGDLVKTLKHRFLPVEILGKRQMVHQSSKERIKDQLYQCSKENYPEIFEPLVLTGCHSILVDMLTQEQGKKTMEDFGCIFITDDKIRLMAYLNNKSTIYEVPGTYTIYHLALENEDYYGNYGIYANGLLVESCSKHYLLEHSNMKLLFSKK